MIPFGPQLIGQTEKALGAVLRIILDGHRLSEAQWVTLRLASQFDGEGDLATFIAERAQLPEPAARISELTRRELLVDDRPTEAGRAVVAAIMARIADVTEPIWASLDPEDAATAARVLESVLEHTRTVLGELQAGSA